MSIPAEVDTYFVNAFENRELNAPPNIDEVFVEALNKKIRSESRLQSTDKNPDVEFSGYVASYKVRSEAPQEGNTTSLNRLEINISVTYTNNLDEEDTFTKSFSFYRIFPATTDLRTNEDDFIVEIFDKITDDVFNQTFTSW